MGAEKIARIGDTTHGTCTAHVIPRTVDGTITTGAEKAIAGGKPIARVGDTVTSSCGHTGIINKGATKATCNGKPIARMNDTFSGDYTGTITSGYNKGSAT
jgi:uncharacterized Zn-binding protein involved in type VI secretion